MGSGPFSRDQSWLSVLTSANTLWILSPCVVCSMFSLGDAPSIYSPFHGRVFRSSIMFMVFVVEKQLRFAPCSPCAISFLWCASPQRFLAPTCFRV